MNTVIDRVTRLSGAILIILSLTVSVPLVIHTWQNKGGPWGFGIIGLPVLIPLAAYILFGVAGMIRNEASRRKVFVSAHVVTLITGLITLAIFPVYPVAFAVIPVLLATAGIINKKHFRIFLLMMIVLAIAANILLLKWELEFGRTIPVLQLFQNHSHPDP
ncbi:MAG: hypothetical protein WA874_20485 [Chryseosolibacter sp.]